MRPNGFMGNVCMVIRLMHYLFHYSWKSLTTTIFSWTLPGVCEIRDKMQVVYKELTRDGKLTLSKKVTKIGNDVTSF